MRTRLSFFDTALQDLHYSMRVLSSSRAFAALSVLCLSLGIGTNTTVFTLVNALLLQPVPLAAPSQLILIQEGRRADTRGAGPASYPNFLDWKAHASDVAEMAAQRTLSVRVSEGGTTDRVSGALVSANFFAVLGLRPLKGRGFLDEEDRPGGAPVVLLSHYLWQERYGGDPAVVGRAITINGVPRTVVGVMPPELSQIAMRRMLRGAQLWIPIESTDRIGGRDDRRIGVFARLRSGLTREMASARFDTVARTLEATHPLDNTGWRIVVAPLRVGFSPRTRAMMLMLMGAVSFVLLIACANVANLTLARASGRRREIATRLALGAPRRRIVRQLLTESLLVALASVPIGIALAWWGRNLLLTSGGAGPELFAAVSIDKPVLIFTIGLAVLTSILTGLLPALHSVRRVHANVLKSGGRRDAMSDPVHTRLSHALIVGEVALALILLVGASLFLKSFRNLLAADGGFDTSGILAVSVEMEEEDTGPSEATSQRVGALVDELSALPGVTAVAAANLMPLRDGGVRAAILPDTAGASPEQASTVQLGAVTAHFFTALNVAVREGRSFTDAEGQSRAAVAVVNKTMAGRFWPNESAIGHRFRNVTGKGGDWFTVVGVSDDILTLDLSDRPLPAVYVPFAHAPAREPELFIRAPGDPALVARPARAAITAVEPTLPILAVRTMTEVHYLALSRNQTFASLFAVLGGIALLLGATGVYGVLSYFVSQRTHEIGIRAALGADRQSLVRLFVRQGMRITLVGVALGLCGAWALARLLREQLHDVSGTDPLSFGGVAILLIGVGFLAAYLPARRAASVDPLIAMRD